MPVRNHSARTTPMMIPANFNIAILLPCCAMRPRRPALLRMFVDRLEKTSF